VRGRIPNRITLTGAAAGLALALLPGGIGIWEAAGGLGVGLAMFLPMYFFRGMGAGDVKLMAAAGTFLGPSGALAAALYAYALGGLLTLAYAWRAHALTRLFLNLRIFAYASAARIAGGSAPSAEDLPLTQLRAPYALAIAAGVLLHAITRQIGAAGA
jgi:prepilin peptidase CpaA